MTTSTHRDCTQGGIATSTLLSSQLKGRLKSREGRGIQPAFIIIIDNVRVVSVKEEKQTEQENRMECREGYQHIYVVLV